MGVIPARYGSARFPGKVLADLSGKPVIQWVYEQACRAKMLDDVWVAADDPRILEAVRGFGGKAVITPRDIPTGSDRVAYAARELEGEIIANIQGDEPLIEPDMINEAIKPLLDNTDVEVTTLARPIHDPVQLTDPNVVKVVMDSRDNALYFSRSVIPFSRNGGTEDLYFKHIGLYVFRKVFLFQFKQWGPSPLERMENLEQLRILENGYPIRVVITAFDSHGVDTPADLEIIRGMLEK
ncbi:3-deoxy-manno-octulosonate cytidylyltransferase [candidate division KSB1 bacterium]|nr:3-deoxy-manno-octulosonate cytidylyltransferase [candidate division KSB1 bacterium]